MDMDKNHKNQPTMPARDAAMEVQKSVRANRKANGKKNPEDCVLFSDEWQAVEEEFTKDLSRALAGDPDECKD
ncbi:hypothetical protein GCM10027093_69510 [Paraburkholderia jirisanensis]